MFYVLATFEVSLSVFPLFAKNYEILNFLLNFHILRCRNDWCLSVFFRDLVHSITHIHKICLLFPQGWLVLQWRLCHAILITRRKRSVQVHTYITQASTAAALSAVKEQETDILFYQSGEGQNPSKQLCVQLKTDGGVNRRCQSASWVPSASKVPCVVISVCYDD